MALRETFWLALDTLRAHKLRSFLTLLGVILAVTTLVAVMSVVEGLNRYIAEHVLNLGADVFVVNKFGVITNFEEWVKAQRRPSLRFEDYLYLSDRLQLPRQVAAGSETRADARYGNEKLDDIAVVGVTGNFAEVRSIELSSGRFLNDTDDSHRVPVCFIGYDLVTRFFPNTDPLGKAIRVGSQVCTVVGVAKALGTAFGESLDNFVYLPLGTFLKDWATPSTSIYMLVQARSPEWMETTQDEVRATLRARRHLAYGSPDNFGIISTRSITGLWQRLTGNLFAIAVGLTSVFLVVGGIVIMNIMLASVTERTREIGIRRSLGARRRHIVMQFLVESAMLAALGGLLGVLAAMGITALVAAIWIPLATPIRAVVLALTLSTAVGLFFGIYPAVRASRLDPIEALRSEV